MTLPTDVALSSNMKTLLKSFLEIDPEKRISWNQFFNHEIFKGFRNLTPKKHTKISNFKSEKKIGKFYISETFNSFNAFDKFNESKVKNIRKIKTAGDPYEVSSRGYEISDFKITNVNTLFDKNKIRGDSSTKKHSIYNDKFHSQRNTQTIGRNRHKKDNRTNRGNSQSKYSINTFITGNGDYGETPRQNLFERNTTKKASFRNDYSEDISPWNRARSSNPKNSFMNRRNKLGSFFRENYSSIKKKMNREKQHNQYFKNNNNNIKCNFLK